MRSGSLETLESATADCGCGAGRHRRGRGARGHQPRAGLLGPVPRQRAICRPPRADLELQCRRLHLASRLPDGPRSRAIIGAMRSRVFETTSATPFFFNFHDGDLGNFTIIGPSGSGKTVVLNFLAAQAQKFSPRTILFDKDRGSEIFLRAHRRPLRADHARRADRLQPAAPARHRRQPRLPARLAVGPARGRRRRGRDGDRQGDRRDLRARPGLRRLRFLRDLLGGGRRPQPGDLPSRLDPWIFDGEHAWLFDNKDDQLDFDEPRARLRHDRAARGPAAAHAGAALPVPPHRGAARRLADDDPDRRGLEGARRPDVRRAHPQLDEDAA